MKAIELRRSCTACMVFALLLLPDLLNAAGGIPLTSQEISLVEQGDIIVREVDNPGRNGRTFEAIGFIAGPPSDIVEILADYKKYPEFMPNVSRIEILEQAAGEAVLNYTLTLPLGKIKR